MIVFEHVTKRFGRVRALDDASFSVAAGEALALWGANGAGKTTAIRCLLGLLRFTGTVKVDGRDVRRSGKSARAVIGYVPQELALYDDLRLTETLRFFGALKRVPRRRGKDVLAEVELASHRRKRVGELSGGMKQRLALAIALLADPPILVLDEPTANLDAGGRGQFLERLRALRAAGKTVLFTSHQPREVETLADRVLIMESGRIARTCPPSELTGGTSGHCVLSVRLADGRLDEAVEVLTASGFTATRNGRTVRVEVPVDGKAVPLRALLEANLDPMDFEVTDAKGELDG